MPNLKGNVAEHTPASQAPHLEGDLANGRLLFGKQSLQAAADHMSDGIGRSELRYGSGDYVTAIAENADSVSDLEHLFHSVVDEQDGHSAAPQLPDDREKPVYLAARERCRGLVHD